MDVKAPRSLGEMSYDLMKWRVFSAYHGLVLLSEEHVVNGKYAIIFMAKVDLASSAAACFYAARLVNSVQRSYSQFCMIICLLVTFYLALLVGIASHYWHITSELQVLIPSLGSCKYKPSPVLGNNASWFRTLEDILIPS